MINLVAYNILGDVVNLLHSSPLHLKHARHVEGNHDIRIILVPKPELVVFRNLYQESVYCIIYDIIYDIIYYVPGSSQWSIKGTHRPPCHRRRVPS